MNETLVCKGLYKKKGEESVMHERSSKQDFRLMMSFITGEVERRNEFVEWHVA